ncbi:MAG: Tad domain-containing protein, partial [Pseudomonadota bacterium]
MTSKLKRYARNFSQSEDGTMTAFGLMMMFAMIIIGGVAFDLLRHEHVRTHLQNVADSSVLAAANMGNTQDPETVVRDYFKKAKLDRFLTEVDAPPGFLTKDVKAIAEASVNTSFMSFAGVPELDVKVLGQARQDAGDVEVAMVLDMSGSMLGQRETNLRTAANKFIDTIMPPDVTVPLEQTPSVSIVPYYDTVNFGPTFGPYWNLEGSRVPEEATAGSSMVSPYAGDVFSYCIRLEDEAFEDVEWDTSVDVERLGQYDSVTN